MSKEEASFKLKGEKIRELRREKELSSTALADAVATSLGNVIQNESDIPTALKTAESISLVKGVLVLVGERMGVWGDVELAKL